jgi:hypothetical protein
MSPDDPRHVAAPLALPPVAASAAGTVVDSDPMPRPGELQIKNRRSWKSWQLALGMIAAALIGMAVNYRTVGASSSSNKPSYTLPPAGGTTTTTTAVSGGTTTTTTTLAGSGSTTTTLASGTTATTVAAGTPAQLLLAAHQSTGNWTSTPFTTTVSGWIIGWAYRCTPVPTSGPSLQVFVTPVGGTPSGMPAVSESGPSGQSITTQTSLGQQTLVVESPAGCEWVVKVTGN